jgi:sulfide:quinone oxidoreductase
METIRSPTTPIRVLLAGGGFAALEAMLALRALMEDRVHVTLVAPEPRFAYRPAATAEAFGAMPPAVAPPAVMPRAAAMRAWACPRVYDLRAICTDLGAEYRRDRLEAVASRRQRARLASFASVDYDALILALGARATVAIPGALTFRDQRDVPQFRALLGELREGAVHRIVFAVPSGCAWPLALYELALMTAAHAEQHWVRAEISVVTPSQTPLALFGAEASRLVADTLAERGVRFHGGVTPMSVNRDGSLMLHFGGSLPADRVVAVPQLRGPRISGVPGDWWGFVPTGAGGSVEGLDAVYAAGDITSCPVKQGGLAAQQADEVACAIAAAHGFATPAPPEERIVQARLLGGPRPLFLRVVLDRCGRPLESSLEHEDRGVGEADSAKVFGRHLTPYLDELEPLVA